LTPWIQSKQQREPGLLWTFLHKFTGWVSQC